MDGQELDMAYAENESLYSDFLEAFGLDENKLSADDFDDLCSSYISQLVKVSNNIIDFYDMDVFSEIADNYDFDETLDLFEYEDIRVYDNIYDMADVAEQYLEETGDLEYHADSYTDEEALLRDLYLGGDIQDYYYNLVKEEALEDGLEDWEASDLASDYEITEEDEQSYLEAIIECCDKKFLTNYFDYEAFGRDMDIDGNFYTTNSGIVEVTKWVWYTYIRGWSTTVKRGTPNT